MKPLPHGMNHDGTSDGSSHNHKSTARFSFFHWKATSVILQGIAALHLAFCIVNLFLAIKFSHLSHENPYGNYSFQSQYAYLGVASNGLIAVYSFVGWLLLKKRNRAATSLGVLLITVVFSLSLFRWLQALKSGLIAFAWFEPVFIWCGCLYAIGFGIQHWTEARMEVTARNIKHYCFLGLLLGGVWLIYSQMHKPDPVGLLRAAAEQGDAFSQCTLGILYERGKGVSKDSFEAVKWYRKAAEQNYPYAQYNLGVCYSAGEGVERDDREAIKWFRKAAEQNYVLAQSILGGWCSIGRGMEKDDVEAAKWFRKAAEQNDATAQYNLGLFYELGRGITNDKDMAAVWYRKSAEQNFAKAQLNLGTCYFEGWGVPQDYAEARKWYLKAAEQDCAEAQFSMGLLYSQGHGVPEDMTEAIKWYRKAAVRNYARAQYYLGDCYAHGNGVAKDEVEAYKWLMLAAAQGNNNAKKALTKLEKSLTQEQIAAGKKEASEFNPEKMPSNGGMLQMLQSEVLTESGKTR